MSKLVGSTYTRTLYSEYLYRVCVILEASVHINIFNLSALYISFQRYRWRVSLSTKTLLSRAACTEQQYQSAA
jgi:hypothetical protein